MIYFYTIEFHAVPSDTQDVAGKNFYWRKKIDDLLTKISRGGGEVINAFSTLETVM